MEKEDSNSVFCRLGFNLRMHDFATVNHVLSELGQRNDIADLRLSAEATVGLCLKDGVEVDFEYDARRNRLYIYTAVLPLPKDDMARLKLYDVMLELNCLEKGLPCGSLSIHRQREVAICQRGLTVPAAKIPERFIFRRIFDR